MCEEGGRVMGYSIRQIPPLFEIICFQLWDFSIGDVLFLDFVSLVFFDLDSSIQVSPRHSAVIITFLGGVYFFLFVCLVF